MCNCCVSVLPTLNPAPCTMCIIEFDIKIIILGKFSAEVSKCCTNTMWEMFVCESVAEQRFERSNGNTITMLTLSFVYEKNSFSLELVSWI